MCDACKLLKIVGDAKIPLNEDEVLVFLIKFTVAYADDFESVERVFQRASLALSTATQIQVH